MDYNQAADRIERKRKTGFRYWVPVLGWVPVAVTYLGAFIVYAPIMHQIGRWTGFVFVIVFGFFFVRARRTSSRLVPRFHAAALGLFCIIMVSNLFNPSAGDMARTASFYLGYFYLLFGIGRIVQDFDDAAAVTVRYVIVVVGLMGLGFLAHLVGKDVQQMGGTGGLFYMNPNAVSALGVVVTPLSYWLIYHFARSRRDTVVAHVLFFLLIGAVWITNSRTGCMAIGAMLVFELICRLKRRGVNVVAVTFFCAVVIGLLAALIILGTPIQDKIHANLTDEWSPGVTTWRTNRIWPIFLREFHKDPWIFFVGRGWGSEVNLVRSLWTTDYDYIQVCGVMSAHNAYLGLTYQIGIFGTLLVFVPLIGAVFSFILGPIHRLDSDRFHLQLAYVSSMVGILTMAMAESGLFNMGALYTLPAWYAIFMALVIRRL